MRKDGMKKEPPEQGSTGGGGITNQNPRGFPVRYAIMIASWMTAFSAAVVMWHFHRVAEPGGQVPERVAAPGAGAAGAVAAGRREVVVPGMPGRLSDLAEVPDWHRLDGWQGVVTRDEFLGALRSTYLGDGRADAWIRVEDACVRIRTGAADADTWYTLGFRSGGPRPRVAAGWRAAGEFPQAPPGRPLDGVRIVLDPGHIGGAWAVMEERSFRWREESPVCEGDLTWKVAGLLKETLEATGAVVSLTRDAGEPVTRLRPEDLMEVARGAAARPEVVVPLARRLFYRTAEIRARAERVNREFRPDLVVCLHFDADGWTAGRPPGLIGTSHAHVLVHGAYKSDELALEDQRFALVWRLVQGIHGEEAAVGARVADSIAAISGLPPFTYPADAGGARNIGGNPYLWARNLLANRLYDCPVVYCEPYVMNNAVDYVRIQAGDYEGTRVVGGVERRSIFREYAAMVADGLVKHYASRRGRVAQ